MAGSLIDQERRTAASTTRRTLPRAAFSTGVYKRSLLLRVIERQLLDMADSLHRPQPGLGLLVTYVSNEPNADLQLLVPKGAVSQGEPTVIPS